MKKIRPKFKMGAWYLFNRLLFFMIPIYVLILCLSTVVQAGSNISEKHSLDYGFTDNAFPNTTIKGNNNAIVGQQNKIIKGKVTDASNGESLPGVNITIAGTVIGTTTNIEGEFTLSVPSSDVTLVFSFIGFEVENIKVGNSSIINVQLKQTTTELEETVVIGYQEVHKRNATASVVSVNSDVLTEIPAASLTTLLSGKVAGVQNLVRTGAPGMRGGGLVIRGNTHVDSDLDVVNGLSSPLYVIDGIPTNLQDLAGYDVTNTDYLSSLNPADIESVNILKDASAAAVYGSRGANGVIIIKTKKGQVGEPEFHFSAYYGITVRPELFKVYTGAADRRFKLRLIEEDMPYRVMWGPYAEARGRIMPLELTDSLNPSFNQNYDFQGMFYRKGIVNSYDFNATGGTEKTNYRIGLGYFHEKGIVVANGFKRYSFNANIRNKFSSKVMNDLTVRMSYSDRETGLGETDPTQTFPMDPISLPASYLYKSKDELDALQGRLSQVYNTNRVVETSLSNLFQIDILEGLKFNSQTGLSTSNSKNNFFSPSTVNDNKRSHGFSNQGSRYSGVMETFLTYNKEVSSNQRLSVLLGHGINFNQYETLFLEGENGSSDGVKTISGYKKTDIDGRSDITSNGMVSYWLRVGYEIKDRYLFDVVTRREASSRFGKDKRWGSFPSASLGWIISEESFWKPLEKYVSYVKFRASYGINGTQHPVDYLRFNQYTTSDIDMYNENMDVKSYGGITAISPDFDKIANKTLGWEETKQWNIATDFTAFNSRLYLTLESYHKYTDGLVFDINFPSYSGYSSAQSNLIDIVNQGWEVNIDAHLFPRDRDFQWEVMLNFSHNDNYVAKLPYGGRDFLNKDKNYAYVLGYSLNIPWMYDYVGTVQDINDLPLNPFTGERVKNELSDNIYKAGNALFLDLNGDYVVSTWSDDDYAYMTGKTADPKITGGFSSVIKYKKWIMRINSSFAFGHYIFNNTMYQRLHKYTSEQNFTNWVPYASYELADDFWHQPGDQTKYPDFIVGMFDHGNLDNFAKSSLFLEKGDYLKISDITLSYTFDQSFIKKMKIGNIRVYSTVSNVCQFQKANVPDASMVDARGYDYGNGYPLSRKFIFGVNVKF